MREIRILTEEIRKSLEALNKIERFLDRTAKGLTAAQRTDEKAVVVAELLSKYYTCLETIFLRISQFFENSLAKERWHADLLDKMTLKVEGVREVAIRDGTRDVLVELLKFRHFTRYYYDISYDWDRLDFLMKKFEQARLMAREDMDRFLTFLHSLDAA